MANPENKRIRLETFARTVMNIQESASRGVSNQVDDSNDGIYDYADDYDSPPRDLLGGVSNTNRFLRAVALMAMPGESESGKKHGILNSYVPSDNQQPENEVQPNMDASIRDDSSVLQGRLDEIYVLELMKDGYVDYCYFRPCLHTRLGIVLFFFSQSHQIFAFQPCLQWPQ
jgi:hypothetical protein